MQQGRVARPHRRQTPQAKGPLSAAYQTPLGFMLRSTIEGALERKPLSDLVGKVDLIFTSPPFPLNRKKAYGNKTGSEYLRWMARLAPKLAKLLSPKGSIVVELGNAWEEGHPTMSTLPMRTLLLFMKSAKLHLCQQFVCYNPARLPSPAQWVTIKRVRVKDSFTHVWWMARDPEPKADNRNVLAEYSAHMRQLLKRQSYNAGERPSGHVIGKKSFLKDNGGAIASNVLTIANTSRDPDYEEHCMEKGVETHPAQMPPALAEFFIRFLTDEGDLVLYPFGGSNTTGATAEGLKRRWVAIEPKREYIQGSRGRFDNAVRPYRRRKS